MTRASIRKGRGWFLLVLPHLAATLLILAVVQVRFLANSLHADLDLGRLGGAYTLANFAKVFEEPVYTDSLRLTLGLSAAAVAISLIVSYPVAYVLARMSPKAALPIMTAILGSSFVSLAIKILGMVIIFAEDGPINRFLRWAHLSDHGLQIIGTVPGVMFGYLHLSIAFMVIMLYAVIHTIPARLEEASLIHGASPLKTFARVVLPLSLPGVVNAGLTQFNLLSGVFVTASILGGGRVLTIPVFIQRSLTLFNDYGMAAALSAVLLVLVASVNLIAGWSARGLAAGEA